MTPEPRLAGGSLGVYENTTFETRSQEQPPISWHLRRSFRRFPSKLYAALDLGTNNCRLLIAKPEGESFRVVDAFSRIVRLGEGLALTGEISEAAQERAIEALKICFSKVQDKHVSRFRFITTQAARQARNGEAFVARVFKETGLSLETIDRRTEARLAALGCSPLSQLDAKGVLLFDIGGGSSELVAVTCEHQTSGPPKIQMLSWASLPIGVVTMADKFGGKNVTPRIYAAMVEETTRLIRRFATRLPRKEALKGMQMLGTSGTVTTLAGIHMNLARYERRYVDGVWLEKSEIDSVISQIKMMDFNARVQNNCIGEERADLVLAGCAILEAIQNEFPLPRLRVADRGLREGLLFEMMRADGVWRKK